ncbi:MAG: hypothetical protein ACI959_002246, partial [Limisphaerales bacterium]
SSMSALENSVSTDASTDQSTGQASAHSISIGSKLIHSAYGKGMVVDETPAFFKIYFHDIDKSKHIERDSDQLELLQPGEGGALLSVEEVEDAIWKVLTKYGGATEIISLGDKWTGGKVVLTPKDPDMQAKEITMDAFFHKIVMVRDRLRVLEQQINGHKKLDDEDRVHLQQYITRAYGSLTTFNVLFKLKSDQFKGAGKAD